MNVKRFIGKCRRGIDVVALHAYATYSQVGEDRIVSYLFHSLNIPKPTYLDIGANEPIISNNTFLFYDRGCRGVCVEPDPEMYKRIRKKRPLDQALNVGIGIAESSNADFYLFPGKVNGWSTFSKEEAITREKASGLRSRVISIPLKTINDIIAGYFDKCPNFISLDVEGLDLAILQSMDFTRFQPEVICVETISFSITNTEEKLQEIIDFMDSRNYFVYADTHVNSIFCRKDLFKRG